MTTDPVDTTRGSTPSAKAASVTRLRPLLATIGAMVYALAGGLIGAQNAGWSGAERNASPSVL